MIERIKLAFDYQRFESDGSLSDIIADTNCRYTELSDDDLSFVSAAGESLNVFGIQENQNDTASKI